MTYHYNVYESLKTTELVYKCNTGFSHEALVSWMEHSDNATKIADGKWEIPYRNGKGSYIYEIEAD